MYFFLSPQSNLFFCLSFPIWIIPQTTELHKHLAFPHRLCLFMLWSSIHPLSGPHSSTGPCVDSSYIISPSKWISLRMFATWPIWACSGHTCPQKSDTTEKAKDQGSYICAVDHLCSADSPEFISLVVMLRKKAWKSNYQNLFNAKHSKI